VTRISPSSDHPLLAGEGTTMAEELHYQSRNVLHVTDEASQPRRAVATSNHPGLKYSSPRPWLLALSLSLAIWALLGWIIWVAFK
jgi:hypothetical protein